jgi:hypothetical protein
MCATNWLVNHKLDSVVRRDYDWVFVFDDESQLVVECLWRLLENNRIRYTSKDDGQRFGLPTPVDAAEELRQRLVTTQVQSVLLCDKTLDLRLTFSSGHILEIIPDSSGYEAWQLYNKTQQFIAVGGGELAVFGDDV